MSSLAVRAGRSGWGGVRRGGMFEPASLLLLLQSVLLEVEEKVSALSELSVRSDNLLLESPAHTRQEAQRLASRLQALKGGLLELQRMLLDKQTSIQVGAVLSLSLTRFMFWFCLMVLLWF